MAKKYYFIGKVVLLLNNKKKELNAKYSCFGLPLNIFYAFPCLLCSFTLKSEKKVGKEKKVMQK